MIIVTNKINIVQKEEEVEAKINEKRTKKKILNSIEVRV